MGDFTRSEGNWEGLAGGHAYGAEVIRGHILPEHLSLTYRGKSYYKVSCQRILPNGIKWWRAATRLVALAVPI